MLRGTFPDSPRVEHIEEIGRFHDLKGLALGLALHILGKRDILEEFRHSHICIEQVQHQHDHYFD